MPTDDIKLWHQYRFDADQADGVSGRVVFGVAIGWIRLPLEKPRDLCLRIHEWRDGYPMAPGDLPQVTALNLKFYTATEVHIR